ncbi:sialate O-acetylesterase [Pantanalinema rosaneae CENA516]|uniref:sialate O-acetylesterase n=1 Tax=Pantanalinema rosaneae TaxID=1620701 RepID=UPI003D6FA435
MRRWQARSLWSLFWVILASLVLIGMSWLQSSLFPQLPEPPPTPVRSPDPHSPMAIRTKIDCRQIPRDRLMVALAFGQSNSANFGNQRRTAQASVYHFHAGNCYRAADPLLGADGNGGSVWTRLGDKIVQQGLFDHVLFASIGLGGSEIRRWTPGGDLHPRLTTTIQQLTTAGFGITHLLWHQGETDAALGTPTEIYQHRFTAMLESIRSTGVQAPIYVSIASRCEEILPQPSIQAAQRALVNPAQGILPGPNTDELDGADRYDRCHFSASGLDKAADLWLAALMAPAP